MKKNILSLVLILSTCLTVSFSSFASPLREIQGGSSLEKAAITPFSTDNYGSKTLPSGGKYIFNSRYFYAGNTTTVSYTLNKAAKISVYFHNSTTGKEIYVKQTSGTSGSASYSPSSFCQGYFYLVNSSSGAVTVKSASVKY